LADKGKNAIQEFGDRVAHTPGHDLSPFFASHNAAYFAAVSAMSGHLIDARGARTGVRGDNDIVWVGGAANHAAKLTELDAAYATWITGTLFNNLADDAKYPNNTNKTLMWEKWLWIPMGNMEIYCSNWTWGV
jgi:class 3 adenylate cyclase